MLAGLILGFIVIVVGANLLTFTADQIYQYGNASSSNVTGTSFTMLTMIPIFFALGVMSGGVAICIISLRNAGIM